MTHLNIEIPDAVNQSLISFLEQHKGSNLENFVADAIQKRLFEITVEKVKLNNSSYSPQEIESLIEEARNAPGN